MTAPAARWVNYAQEIEDLPTGIKQCSRCAVLIGVAVRAAESNSDICSWCESEILGEEYKEKAMSEITEERVAQWAEWRRNGKSYGWISDNDTLGPSYPTIKKYLEDYGYTTDGDRTDETPPPNLPEGWGEVETDVIPPTAATSKYAPLIEYIDGIISPHWARIEAPGEGASSYFANQLRKHIPGVETANRTVKGKKYFYFRLKEAHGDKED